MTTSRERACWWLLVRLIGWGSRRESFPRQISDLVWGLNRTKILTFVVRKSFLIVSRKRGWGSSDLCEAVLIDKAVSWFGTGGVSMKHWVTHLHYGLRRIYSDFGGCGLVNLEGEDKIKLKYMTAIMTTSRSSGNSTCVNWLMFFNEGDGSPSEFVVEDFLLYYLIWYVLSSGLEEWLSPNVFPLAILIAKARCFSYISFTLFGFPVHTARWVRSQHCSSNGKLRRSHLCCPRFLTSIPLESSHQSSQGPESSP